MTETRARFRASQRLRSSRDFEAIYRSGSRVHAGCLVLYGRFNSLGHNRLGITVSRKIGGAVVRNRVKRQIREIFRTGGEDNAQGVDLVVNAKRPIVTAPFVQIQAEFRDSSARLRKLLEKAAGAGASGGARPGAA